MEVIYCFLICTLSPYIRLLEASCEATLVMGNVSPDPGLGVEIDIDCQVSNCADGYSIDWKKWVLNGNGVKDKQLTLYRFSPLGHEAVDRGSDYDIKGRTDYYITRDKHSLYIKDLFIKDNGTWTCDVIIGSDTYTSNELNIIIPVRANVENVKVTTQREEIVDGQTEIFHCNVTGANPAPYVKWNMTGKDDITGESVNKIVDGYWSVHSAASLRFPEVRVIDVICTVGSDDYGWVSQKKEINVQARASVDEPSNGRDEIIDVNSSFNFNCKASGYKPRMKWRLGTEYIDNGPLYNISSAWDDTSASSILISKPLSTPYDCETVTSQQGFYTCDATLEPPYQHSNDISPRLTVQILYVPISQGPRYKLISARKDEEVDLHCRVCANPTPIFKWKYGTNAISPESENLTVHVTLITAGMYSCEASNQMGYEMIYFNVVIEGDEECLSAGKIVGIVFGVMVGVLSPVLLIMFFLYKRKNKDPRETRAYENGEQSHQELSQNSLGTYELQGNIGKEVTLPIKEYSELNKTGLYSNAEVNVYDKLHQTS